MRTFRQKVRQKCVPLGGKFGSKRQKGAPFTNKCVENAYPRAEIGLLRSPDLGQSLYSEGAILNPLSLLLLDFALPVANKLVLTSGRVRFCPCICRAPCSSRARRAHCAYRRVAPSALLNGAPSARWSYPVKNLPLAVFHSSLASAGRLALCAPEGRIAPIGASYPESVVSSRIDDHIPNRVSAIFTNCVNVCWKMI